MKNSKIMVDIVTKENTVVTAVGTVNNGIMTVNRETRTSDLPAAQVNVMLGVATVLDELNANGIKDRVCVILPETVVLRGAAALKAKKDGIVDIGNHIIKEWMIKKTDNPKAWINACTAFGTAIKNYSGTILFVNARSLYRWEVKGTVDGTDLKTLNGVEVTFTNGTCVEHALVVAENQYYNGTVKIQVQTITDRNGQETTRAFVPRFINCTENGQATTLTAFEASDFRRQLTAKDATAAIINALRLHVQAVTKLPKLQIATSVVVNDQ